MSPGRFPIVSTVISLSINCCNLNSLFCCQCHRAILSLRVTGVALSSKCMTLGRIQRTFEKLCCGNITIFIYAVAFQTCLTTLLSRSVHHISRSNKDINSVATLDSVFSSVTKRKWYVPSFPVLACSWGGRERYMASKYQLEKSTSL